ncbi:hypothetical protein M446_0805 [Methylobacterium sp. 4-46]|uniref:hypothetical protein n=1 Tax=unclassified Methylobacterium TaxID=2615210 RepID=UPI000165C87E|nr:MULTISPECIES: hypothetical protein [Methylobacterium]ACA15359.1 hypothetical protein M446_0805 [Methylobacterium sp. 4-46]WFT81081.1 hypothetical protein QA634_04035 [Methylobacterium nodulans]
MSTIGRFPGAQVPTSQYRFIRSIGFVGDLEVMLALVGTDDTAPIAVLLRHGTFLHEAAARPLQVPAASRWAR